jgi:hypothetical protein
VQRLTFEVPPRFPKRVSPNHIPPFNGFRESERPTSARLRSPKIMLSLLSVVTAVVGAGLGCLGTSQLYDR